MDEVRGLGAGDVLAAARERRAAADRAEAELLVCAVEWVYANPLYDDDGSVLMVTAAGGEFINSGPGCPEVDVCAAAEFGAALGMGSTAAEAMLGQALELKLRLPRLWQAVQSGRLPAWKARRVAALTGVPWIPADAAAWIDRQAVLVAHRAGAAWLERIINEAIARFNLTRPVSDEGPDDRGRHVDVRLNGLLMSHGQDAPTVDVTATLDLLDAMDLDHALQHGAETLKALGSAESLNVRRSLALGDLARQQTALNLFEQQTGQAVTVIDNVRLPKARQLVLHLHLSAHAVQASNGTVDWSVDPLVRIEHGQRLLSTAMIKDWLGGGSGRGMNGMGGNAAALTSISVRPVLDPYAHQSAPGYAIPERLRDQIIARDGICRFPYCGRNARRCQIDHVIPYDHAKDGDPDQPGPTDSRNLHALCAKHHALKTSKRWHAEMPHPSYTLWTSPQGYRYLVDRDGTREVEPGEQFNVDPPFETAADPPER